MRTVGIIAEYNPFHTGHEYHIRKARELSGADYVIVVMSPDFVQRGEPAVFDKYTRTRMALQGGADLVIELPVCYATGSAEYFAEGATALLDSLGTVNTLCFGGESDDISLFQNIADILIQDPKEYTDLLRSFLKQGMTYPQARCQALSHYLKNQTSDSSSSALLPDQCKLPDLETVTDFLSTPNNILGIEYCKALKKIGSSIKPLPLKRQGNGYNSSSLEGIYCSATAVRNSICNSFRNQNEPISSSDMDPFRKYIPESNHVTFASAVRTPLNSGHFLPYLYQKFLSADDFSSVLDISSDLSDRLRSNRFKCIGISYEELVSLLKTRQITESRIRRALLHLILNIEEKTVESFRTEGIVFYAHVMGFKKSASPLLHELKQQTQIPFITKTSSAEKNLSETAKKMWKQDFYASHLYRSVLASTYGIPFRTEYECSPIIL